jgi:hypothetical protein
MRTFTLKQAQELLPVLETLLRRSMKAKATIDEVDGELQELSERIFISGGLNVSIAHWAIRKGEREKALQAAKDAMAEIDSIGVQIKDLDIGLLDFPCRVEGEILLLCWKMGEPAITHWHGTDEGFANRKPIDSRIANAGRGPAN